MTSADPALSPAEADAVVARRLAQITPPELPERAAGVRPVVVLIGGQPAAGKTTIQELVQAALDADRTASYDFDDDPPAHPRYDAIMRANGIRGNEIVDESLPPDLRRRCLDHLRTGDTRYDVVASAPMQSEDAARQWADGFRDAGYRVTVVYVATDDANSLLGVANRYQQARDDTGIGRWVKPAHHDHAYRGVPDAAHALESQGYVDDIYVVDRDGQVLFENHRNADGSLQYPPGAREAIVAERNRPPTPVERDRFLATALPLRQRDPALPPLEEPVDDAIRDAMRREAQRGGPQPSPREPSAEAGLDQRLLDLQRITGAGLAPARTITPPPTGSSRPDPARGSTGRSPETGPRDR
ncbi:hypothetical protein GCM10009789_56900 [Kribbella sancticallisti]|uniref:UDP-N-acetylglucosamine kinase n=1 Tax=Kribbella sancticallisti TaxID=460087 RepID=A0ABP4Q536_9ACTN